MNELSPVFIHSKLDDAGLTASEFRIVCHVARRGICFAAVESISRICRLSEGTVRAGLKSLAAQGLLIRETREGQTTVHRLAPMANWNPSHILPPLGKEGSGVNHNPTPPERREATPRKIRESHPPQNMGGEGDPFEVTPSKINPMKGIKNFKPK